MDLKIRRNIIKKGYITKKENKMSRIVSFDQFKTTSDKMSGKSRSYSSSKNEGHEEHEEHDNRGGHQHYMFFQNLISIKHHIEEILNMNPDQVDDLLQNGHDWACDHIATSKDDIQEVGEWLRNEMEMSGEGGEHHEEEEEEEPENVVVDIEGDNDEVEVADNGEGSEEDEEDDDEEEEEEEEQPYNEDDDYNLGEGFDDDDYEE
jgi:hypothetical protein